MTSKISFSPRNRKSPYFDATRRCGAKEFSVYNKMYLPMGYSGPETEFWNLIKYVNLWDGSPLQVQGPKSRVVAAMEKPFVDLGKTLARAA